METFTDKIIRKVISKKSHVVVGLDPVYDLFPENIKNKFGKDLKGISDAIFEFNCQLIDAIYDLVPVIKPQVAFYERYGLKGMEALYKTIKYARQKGLLIIEDAKKNDIASTAKAYSDGHIGKVHIDKHPVSVIDIDALTVNPLLGSDGILPFVKDVVTYGKGIFVLVKTSNPSSVEIQDLNVLSEGKERKIFEIIAELVDKWGASSIGKEGYSSVGAVVGATYPHEARILRKLMPKTYFLVPGYGTQGGTPSDVIHFFNDDGLGALISASRSINYAYKTDEESIGDNFSIAARKAVRAMNAGIEQELKLAGLCRWHTPTH